MPAAYHLAQLNIARALAPIESAQLDGFNRALDPVNARADAAPGFVWRLQTEEGNATSLRPYDDDLMIVNMSVWESFEELRAFAYSDREHLDVLRQRKAWFETMTIYLVLWWVPAGHTPTVEEAKERLERLRAAGPSPAAFTFRAPFPAPLG